MSPLPPIDTAQVAEFWSRFLATGAVDPATPVPSELEPFGDSAELADELLEIVIHGPKRATASSVAGYELESEALPEPGLLTVATDGSGRARAVLRTTDVRVGPLSSVDDAFAWDEGEGDRTRATWLNDHHAYFRRYHASLGIEFDPDMPTIFERFEVLYTE